MKLFYDDVNRLTIEGYDGERIVYKGAPLEVVNSTANIEELELGVYHYCLVDGKATPIKQRFFVKSNRFDELYTDSSVNLGSYIQDGKTHFTLWAPTAYQVNLLLNHKTHPMTRNSKGFFSIVIDDDCSGQEYLYEVHRDGEVHVFCDPYAKATLPNRKASVVTDLTFEKVKFEQKSDVILEMHVRDFSMDPNVPFKQRGKLLGLLESHEQFGYHHVNDLGVGVLQLQPLTDFETVDELNPLAAYNWGYDPMQFFALEGSYSSNIADAQQVLRDFSTVVNQFHQDGFAVTMDVVYNHIYEIEGSSLNTALPYYYFRYVNGVLSDGTYCGNEIASEFTMVRKFIKDACIYFVEQFDIDGYRFDLMGITDITTMNEIYDELVKIKPSIFLYGEGWNLHSGLAEQERATMQNHDKLPHYGFFNDKFRNVIGGPLDGSSRGILGNEPHWVLEDVLNGSPSLFDSPNQSINYVECHDNYSMADKMKIMGLDAKAAKAYLEATVLAKGHPFLQIGQSFLRNKQGVENSYKSSDDINMIRWHQLIEYNDLNEYTKELIQKRLELKQYNLRFTDKIEIVER